MKKTVTFILLLCLLGLSVSCNNWTDKRKLSHLEKLSVTYPDSALFLLDAAIHPRLLAEEDLATWCLLKASIHHKLHKEMDLDTVFLRRSILYFEKLNKPIDAAKTAIYLGEAFVYYQNHNNAVDTYLYAIDKIAGIKGQDLMRGDIYCHLGDLLHEEGNYEQAARLYMDASQCFYQVKDLPGYGDALRKVAKEYLRENKLELTMSLCNKIDSIAQILNDSTLMSYAADYQGVVYMKSGKNSIAETYLLKSAQLDSINNPHVYLSLSRLYHASNEKDKASFYLNKFKSSKDLHSLSSYWWQKYILSKKDNKENAALHALEHYMNYQDTIRKTEENLYITELAKKYQYSKLEDENASLSSKTKILILLLACTPVLLAIGYFKYWLKTSKVKAKELELEIESMKRREKEIMIERKDKELELLKKSEILVKQNLLKRSLMFTKIRMLSELRTSNPKVFQEETEKILNVTTLSEEEWSGIKEEMNFAFPEFTDKLSRQIPKLTEEEIRFCCLLKAGLDTAALATLLNINTTSVDRRRTRINKKIREVFPDSSWQDFIENL